MRFLIVVPRYINSHGKYYEFPLGLAYISSSLKKNGREVECLNLNHHTEPVGEILRDEIMSKGIDVICTGGLSMHYEKVKDIINSARKIKPDIITILGGGIVSSDPPLVMEALRPQFSVIGEGEETIVELADAIAHSGDLSSIKGIVYYDRHNELITPPPRQSIKDIDSIPYPDYEGFEIERYLDMQTPNDEYHLYPFDKPRMVPIIASRSCPYNCTFCYHPLGKKYRQRSLDALFAEIEYLTGKYDVNMISIIDELFSMEKERIQEFCLRIKRYNVKYLIQMRVDSVDEATLFMLRDSGCFVISYGLESASDTVLKSMKKHITISQIEKALEATCKTGIGIQGNFIFGDRAETWDTANETLAWWSMHKKYLVNLTPIFVYPGTELYKHALSRRIISNPRRFLEEGCPQVNVTEMSDYDYGRLMGLIGKYTIENPLPAKVISCMRIRTTPYKGDIYTVRVKCPHCFCEITYSNVHQDCTKMFPLGCRMGCRVCNQRFDLLPFKFYEYIRTHDFSKENTDIFHDIQTVAIYGAGISGSNAYEYCKSKEKRVLYFIDDFKEGKWCGLDIIKPAEVNEYPRPDLTVFASGSMNYLHQIIEKMENWRATKTFLFSQNFPLETFEQNESDAMLLYYWEYYFNQWLPLQEEIF